MPDVDITIEICGMSGDGTISAGGLLNAAMSHAGFSVMAFDSYPAEIRGFGRCVTRSRIGTQEMLALDDQTHVLISLDDEQSISRIPYLSDNAVIFFDNRPSSNIAENRSITAHIEPDANLLGVPFVDLASEASGTTRGRNLTALGAFAAIAGLMPQTFRDVIEFKFMAKGEAVLNSNLKCFDAGYNYAKKEFKDRVIPSLSFSQETLNQGRVLYSGNTAISKGAMDAGLKLYFGYPITPATPIMEYLAKALPEKGGRILQMEDEISSIGAVLGSFYAGKRAMTATSGPGFALMTELISYGVMAEIPAVIVNAQRGGPSTGLPTKTEQSDLHAAVFGGPGDSPRIVIAPSNVSECYEYTVKSFQIAEKYQTPVIVLTDFFLDNRVENIVEPKANKQEVADGNIYPDNSVKGEYKRFELTESGISPRSIPGSEGLIYTATGLEHTEKGMPDYTADNHMEMSSKRHRKVMNSLKDLFPPEEFLTDATMDVGIIAWGSSFGSVLEAVQKTKDKGLKTGALKISSLFPYHAEEIRQFMDRCKEVLIPELNFEGQLANLIGHLHRKEVKRFNRATGTPLSVSEIVKKIEKICDNL